MSDKDDPWGAPSDGGEPGETPARPSWEQPTTQQPAAPSWQQPQPGTPGPQPGQPVWGQQPQPGQQGQPGWGQYGGAPGPTPYPSSPGYGYGGPPAPPYGAQPYYGPQTSSKATTVLVLGIVSLVLMFSCIGFIPAIIALVLARGAEREIAESGGRLGGAGQVKAGRIMSWITIILSALGAVAFAILIGVAVTSDSTSDPVDGPGTGSSTGALSAFDLTARAG